MPAKRNNPRTLIQLAGSIVLILSMLGVFLYAGGASPAQARFGTGSHSTRAFLADSGSSTCTTTGSSGSGTSSTTGTASTTASSSTEASASSGTTASTTDTSGNSTATREISTTTTSPGGGTSTTTTAPSSSATSAPSTTTETSTTTSTTTQLLTQTSTVVVVITTTHTSVVTKVVTTSTAKKHATTSSKKTTKATKPKQKSRTSTSSKKTTKVSTSKHKSNSTTSSAHTTKSVTTSTRNSHSATSSAHSTQEPHSTSTAAATTTTAVSVSGCATTTQSSPPPIITISRPQPTTYLHTDTLPLEYAVTDAGSGIKSHTAEIDGSPLAGHTLKSGSTLALLKTLKIGPHTFTVKATNKGGASASKSVTFTIIATPTSIFQDVLQFVSDGTMTYPTAVPIEVELLKAEKYQATSHCLRSAALYNAVINRLKQMTGNGVNPIEANIVIDDAQYLIAHCPA